MEEERKEEVNKAVDKIEWLGIDGLLVSAFFVVVVGMFFTLKYRVDVFTGYIFPFILLTIVIGVTISYAMTLGGFIRMQNEKIKANKEEKKK